MDNSGSIVEFFYNIVPGALFLLLLWYFDVISFDVNNIKDGNALTIIFIFLVISLFLGFLFQATTMVFRRFLRWNNRNFKKVICTNPVYKIVEDTFPHDIKSENCNYENRFYLMDARLRSDIRAFLPTHFSSLFAFWSNTFCTGIFLILILVIRGLFGYSVELQKNIALIFIAFLTLISWFFADILLKSFYDSILNSYYMKYVKDIEDKKKTKSTQLTSKNI